MRTYPFIIGTWTIPTSSRSLSSRVDVSVDDSDSSLDWVSALKTGETGDDTDKISSSDEMGRAFEISDTIGENGQQYTKHTRKRVPTERCSNTE
jgi:hypothetical protein